MSELVVSQVSQVPVVSDLEHQDFLQVALEAALELDPQTLGHPAGLEVLDSVATLPCLEASALVPFMETPVSALSLVELDTPASFWEAELQAAVSDQAMEAPPSAWEAYLDPLALAREQASEAAALPDRVHRDVPARAPEAFQADPLTVYGVAHKASAPMFLAATTVFMADFLLTATATMVLVWAASTD